MSLNTTAPSYTAGQVLTASQMNALQDGIQAVWTTYTPSWTAATTNPVIGNGTINGRYLQIGKFVTGTITIVPGSTTTYGTGSYTFSPPVTPRSSVMIANYVQTAPSLTAMAYGSASLLVVLLSSGTALGSTNNTMVNGSTTRIAFLYEAS